MARLAAYILEALESLLRNKMRTSLTLLGMVIGVAAVVCVYGLSAGAQASINSGANSSNNPTLIIDPDPKQSDPGLAQLSFRDYIRLKTDLSGVATRITPVYSAFQDFTRRFNIRNGAKRLLIDGFSWYGGDQKFNVKAGRAISEADELGAANVCVVSEDLAHRLFAGADEALGQPLDIKGTRFTIVGVADTSSGTASNYFGGSYFFVLPFTTFNNFAPGKIDSLYIWLPSLDEESSVRATALERLAQIHGERAKYDVTSMRDQIKMITRFLSVVGVGLTAIGAISLFVAGIGIMNVMLVTVTERTREIGLRKSIGAAQNDIALQFVVEAALISVIGGALGFLISAPILLLASNALASKLGSGFAVPYASAFAFSFIFSLAVGLAFGVYPALLASRLNPVEALRS